MLVSTLCPLGCGRARPAALRPIPCVRLTLPEVGTREGRIKHRSSCPGHRARLGSPSSPYTAFSGSWAAGATAVHPTGPTQKPDTSGPTAASLCRAKFSFHGHPRGVGARGAPGTQPVPLDNQMAKKRLHHFHPPDRTGPGHILLGGVGGNHQAGPALGPAIPGHGHPDTVRRLSLSSEHTRLPTSSLPPSEGRSTQKEGGGSQNQSWLLLALSELERKPRCPAGRTLKSNPSLVHPGSQDRRGSVA